MTPKLYGDGTHDDQPALQAVIDGKPIEIVGDCAHWEGGSLHLHPDTICRIAQPIVMPPASELSPAEAMAKIIGAIISSSVQTDR